MSPQRGVLLLFLDGVGIGPDDARRNPFFSARLPNLRALVGGSLPTLDTPRVEGSGAGRPAATAPLDARLGIEGTPQSGTGQTTILTGRNGARLFGRHFGPWVPVRLRPMVENDSILARAVKHGLPSAFANAYPEGWPGARGGRRLAAPPLAARGAGLLTRHHRELGLGRAVASEILNTGWQRHLGHHDLPDVTAEEAGRVLGRVAADHALTLYAHYATDTAGHSGDMEGCVSALERVDRFLGGLLETLPPGHTLLVCSDHGNLEDLDTRGHTLNPALGIVAGPSAPERARELGSLQDLTPAVAGWLGIGGETGA